MAANIKRITKLRIDKTVARQFLRLRDRRGGSEGRQGTIPELHDLERSLEILLGKER